MIDGARVLSVRTTPDGFKRRRDQRAGEEAVRKMFGDDECAT